MEAMAVKAQELITFYGLKIVAAIAIFVIGRYVAIALRGVLRRAMSRSAVDETLVSFVANLTYAGMLAFVVIAALGQLGVQTLMAIK